MSTALLFPGQGAQFVGMGRELLAEFPAAKSRFEQAEEILGYDLLKLCLEGPEDELNSTVHSQPAIYVASLAALDLLREKEPEVVASAASAAGLSLGEYTALAFAEAISFEDGLRLVQERGSAMQAAADARASGMVSVLGLDEDQVDTICEDCRRTGEILQIANYLCPGNIVVSGDLAACNRVEHEAKEAGAMKSIPLAVAGAFHTPIMKPAVERLKTALANVEINSPRIPVYSNVDAASHEDPAEIRELLVQQLVSPVLWEESMRNMIDADHTEFYEVGPGKVLRGLLRRINRKLECHNVSV